MSADRALSREPRRDLASTPESRRIVAAWLFVCAAMVFAMVLIGGITRLTESGLSIVEWQPLIGAIPPMSELDWQALFLKYQTSPQFKHVNQAMTLAEFKTIFWWEYIHRLWGRLIGAVFLLPFLGLLFTRRIGGALGWKLGGIFVLGGLQGAMGWYMVASGLIDRPEVSQYRLVAHLGLALLIYGLLLWQGLRLVRSPSAARGVDGKARLATFATGLLILVTLTFLAGGFVAGLDAGLLYNTFPLMEGRIVPPDYGTMTPWWRDWFENRATVQFHHRVLAIATLAAVLVFARQALGGAPPARLRRATIALTHVALLQVALGIATLLLVVPVSLAVLHQAGALALFTAALWLRFELRAA
ncbi:MAG: COX15/CtaA family protein [Alphaproteobacteria bacterium]|nr:COX15/CtaA family protein [Alphaproteobacteria bacterium]